MIGPVIAPPLVKSVPKFMRHVRKHVQHHGAPGEPRAGSLFGDIGDYDGAGDIRFGSRESMQTAPNEPIYLEKIKPDERRIIDLDGCLSFISEEHVMYNEIPGP